MTTIFNYLMSTPQSALLIGFSAATALATGVIAFRSFLRFRHISLLYLSILVFLLQLFPVLYNSDPLEVYDMQGNPLMLRLTHFLHLLIIIGYYKFTTAVFTSHKLFRWVFITSLFFQLITILWPNELTIQLASVSSVLFFWALAFYVIIAGSTQKWATLFKIGSCIGVIGISSYPIARLGILPFSNPELNIPYILVITFTIFSLYCLLALLELGREHLDKLEKASLRNMARAFIQLRDLMNTPFQTLELSIKLLQDRCPDEALTLQRMEKSLAVLRKVDASLAEYEQSVDWENTDSFINLKSD